VVRQLILALLVSVAAPPAFAQSKPPAGRQPAPPANAPKQEITGAARPLSGDLITIAGTRVRLAGIAAPMTGQTCRNRYGHEYDCFQISVQVLTSLIADRDASCTVESTDRTGQKVALCRVEGVDLGTAMVARGWAFAYHSLSPDYAAAEAYAQSRRLGMWAGQVEKPWQFESRRLREQAK